MLLSDENVMATCTLQGLITRQRSFLWMRKILNCRYG